MFVLAAPGKDLRAYALYGKGITTSRATRAFTGSDTSTGFIGRGIRKALDMGGKRSETVAKWGRLAKISPEDALTIEKRINLMQDLAKELNVDEDLLLNAAKRTAIADEVFKTYSRYLNKTTEDYLRQAFIHQPDALTSVALIDPTGVVDLVNAYAHPLCGDMNTNFPAKPKIIYGSGVPNAGVGVDGNYYVNTSVNLPEDANTMYGPKKNGVWPIWTPNY
jgi:hypothetical protein